MTKWVRLGSRFIGIVPNIVTITIQTCRPLLRLTATEEYNCLTRDCYQAIIAAKPSQPPAMPNPCPGTTGEDADAR